jgi:hypothetical protein
MANSISSVTTGTGGIVLESVDTSGNTNIKSGTTTIVAVTSTGAAVTGTLSASGVLTATGGITVGATAAPAFSANGGTVSASNNTNTKVPFNTEKFDTNSNYDNVTNYRFTPTVAGYYQINATIGYQSSATGLVEIDIFKNGSRYFFGTAIANSSTGPQISVSSIVSLNGSTDYIEIYGYQSSGGALNITGYDFSGAMIRSA